MVEMRGFAFYNAFKLRFCKIKYRKKIFQSKAQIVTNDLNIDHDVDSFYQLFLSKFK